MWLNRNNSVLKHTEMHQFFLLSGDIFDKYNRDIYFINWVTTIICNHSTVVTLPIIVPVIL